ncbi:hypothetical protein TNCT_466181 [Trichonephila clavata]|uniref:Secreted protein n=1 Tax=Trichonephila clavata TaxID=2740835 RepID=A0A8X6LJG2_TRICU|nr:hypothetical protein TNCT_466181 [Trichonephila clavata]
MQSERPPASISTLSWWVGLCALATQRAMSAVTLLLVVSPKPNRSSLGRSQTKRDTPRRRKTLIPNLHPASVLHVRSGLGVYGAKRDFYLQGAPDQQKLHITSS